MSPRNNLEFTKDDSQEKAKKKKLLKAAVGTVAAGAVALGVAGCADGEKSPSDTSSKPAATGEEVPGNTNEQPGNDGGETSGEKTAENGDKYDAGGQRLEHNGKPIDFTSHWDAFDEPLPDSAFEWAPEGVTKALDEASVQEFDRYPLADRVQWAAEREAYFARSGVGAFDIANQPLGTGNRQDGDPYTASDLNIAIKPLTKTSSANDIVLHYVYTAQLRGMQPAGNLNNGDLTRDTASASKLLSATYADPEMDSYRLLRDSADKYPEVYKEPAENFLTQNTHSVVDKPIVTKETEFDGVERAHREMVFRYDGDTYKSEWVFVPYKEDIDTAIGVEKLKKDENGSWVMVSKERSDFDDF